jgi:hypothetical protein
VIEPALHRHPSAHVHRDRAEDLLIVWITACSFISGLLSRNNRGFNTAVGRRGARSARLAACFFGNLRVQEAIETTLDEADRARIFRISVVTDDE